jgi:hypothetical protein
MWSCDYWKFVRLGVVIIALATTTCGGQFQSSGGCTPSGTTLGGDGIPPSTPSNLFAVALSPSRIDLSWDASIDNASSVMYKIYQNDVFLSIVSTPSYSALRLDPAAQYCFTVSAIDLSYNESSKSNRSCATTLPDLTPPTAPGNLTATADLQTRITLTWTASTDDGYVAGYQIYREGSLISTTTGTQFTDSGLSAETQYCYTVLAFDGGGKQSAPSGQACATTSWKYTTVDSNVEVQWTSIAVDANDIPHIAYYDGLFTGSNQQVGTINYATSLSGTWQSEVVDSVAPIVYGSLSMLVNTDGALHIAYYDFYNNYALRHATRSSGAWLTESINTNVINVTTVSMAHDAKNNLHLVLNPSGIVTYMTNTTGVWTSKVIGNNGVIYGGAATCAIAVDTAGKAYVGSYDYTNQVLKYTTNALGSWATETVDSAVDVGLHTAIAVDAGGKTHLSYYDVTNGDLRYATNATGSWVIQTVDRAGDVGRAVAIALDANGSAHISYIDVTNNFLKYATNASGSWVTSTKDVVATPPWYSAYYTSIAVDSTGKVHISYRGEENHLRYVTNR